MQLMTWPLARLGSRFGLLFEPGRRRVMHSGLGRFLDRPLDLAVGLIEPDGTERVLPFTADGAPLYAAEQFERTNSITFRGYSERYGLRLELNFHSPFYPRNEALCLSPVIYVEIRVTWADRVRLRRFSKPPGSIPLFIRLRRDDTDINATEGRIDLAYDVPLAPHYAAACGNDGDQGSTDCVDSPCATSVHVCDRLQSLNPGSVAIHDDHGGSGLQLDLPVTAEGSGIKWRLVWASYCGEPILDLYEEPVRLRYRRHWPDLDAVMDWATRHRDDNLALSRRFEKLLEQAPANRARAHLTNLAFQSFLANTFWCETDDGSDHFSVWEGNYMYHNTLDVAYNLSLFFFAFWPDLLRMCLAEWAAHCTAHTESDGAFMHHDMGRGMAVRTKQAYGHSMPVEESSNYLLLLQAYIHWTGDLKPVQQHVACIRQLARYLLWTDRDNSGFATAGTANTLDDAAPAMQSSHHQTYLAIKRVCALDAAADLLDRGGDPQAAEPCRLAAAQDVPKIEQAAWLSDHFAVCVDPKTVGVQDSWTGQAVPMDELKGWDDYSIHTSNALLLPLMTAQPVAFDRDRLIEDMINAQRETMRPYGCAYTSSDQDHIRVSQNLWRDFIGRYLHVELEDLDSQYWDMQVAANTGEQSFGYTDAYVTGELVFHPRGVTAFGHLIAGPRLVVDRLDDHFIGVWPDRHRQQRWPLLPLADWAAGKIPVCVVDAAGEVSIEGEIEPVRVQGQAVVDESMIG